MFGRQKSNKKTSNKQNTQSKSIDTRKGTAEEERNKSNASGAANINNILGTGNANAVREILGNSEENKVDLFGDFDNIIENGTNRQKAEEIVNTAFQKKVDDNKISNDDEDEDDLFGDFDNIIENGTNRQKAEEIVNTAFQKKGDDNKISNNDEEDEDDLFGGFDSIIKNGTNRQEAEKIINTAPQKNINDNKISNDDNDEDDLFGGFDNIIADGMNRQEAEEIVNTAFQKKGNDNKISNDEEEDEDDLFGSFGNIIEGHKNEGIISTAPKKKTGKKDNNIISNSDDESSDSEEEIITTSVKKKPEVKKIAIGRANRPEFYEDPEEENLQNGNADLFAEEEDTESNRAVRGHRKGRKKKKNDLDAADADQKRVAGLNFTLQKLPKRKKAGAVRKFFTKLAFIVGNTFGKGLNWLGTGIRSLFSSDYRRRFKNALSNNAENPNITQERRNHDRIPGWNGAAFQKGPNGEDNILADFRRIPTVWSQLTAAKAEDDNGKPLPPTISAYIRQSNEAEDTPLNGSDPGHAGIGIEYSRFSRRTNRYERYNLRYGFFPAGDEKKAGALSTTGNAVIPGQLKDESNFYYTIRRTYPATAKQVNRILKASETYADKGYNSFKRNCTTFVREMFQKEARIPAGKEIFEQEAPRFSSLVNAGIFAGKSSEFSARVSMEGRLEKMGRGQDLNYGGDGNMRANQQDYRQYKESIANSNGGYVHTADLPNVVAENMRRLEGDNIGAIGSRQYFGTATPKNGPTGGSSGSGGTPGYIPVMDAGNIRNAINAEANQLTAKILSVSGKKSMEELLKTPGLDRELKIIVRQIQRYGEPLNAVKQLNSPTEMRQARSRMDKQISDMNTLLNIFHNDARLHLPVVHMISLLEWGNKVIDREYSKASRTGAATGDVGYLRGRLDQRSSVSYEKPNPDPNARRKKIITRTEMTPSHYESYLQIYKSPEIAINTYHEYVMLRNKDNRTKEENARYEKLKRIDNLADQYDNAHNYMLEKDSYSQQDVDYAFSLSKMEKDKNVYGPILLASSSAVYKSLILEKVFGEFSDRLENDLSLEDTKDHPTVQKWLDNDMTACINRKSDEMETVIKGLKKSMPKNSTPENILKELMTVLQKDWIERVLDPDKSNFSMENNNQNKMYKARKSIKDAFKSISNKSQLKTKLSQMIRRVCNEEAQQDLLAE